MLMGSVFFDLLGDYFVLVEPVYIFPNLNTMYLPTLDYSDSNITEYTHDMLCIYFSLWGQIHAIRTTRRLNSAHYEY